MKKVVIKYKGYKAELTPIKDSCSNYNTMLHIFKGKEFIMAYSIRDYEPINVITERIEQIIKQGI